MLLIDDFENDDGLSQLGTPWRLVTDRVMGGVSTGRMSLTKIGGRRALCMKGDLSLKNNGGFVQTILDLGTTRYFNASSYTGIHVVVRGNCESYNLHLKTADICFPWQSYRSTFLAGPDWREIHLPFLGFESYRTDSPLDTGQLTRLGLVAIGRAFTAHICVSQVDFYQDRP